MSYQIVKSATLDLENIKATFNSASNNLKPLRFEQREMNGNGHYREVNDLTERDQFTLELIKYVLSGELKLRQSVSRRIRYAFLKTKLKERELFDEDDILKSYRLKATNKDDVPKIKALIETFNDAYNEKDEKVQKILKVVEDNERVKGAYVTGIRDNGKDYSWTTLRDYSKVYDSQKEVEIAQMLIQHKTVIENY